MKLPHEEEKKGLLDSFFATLDREVLIDKAWNVKDTQHLDSLRQLIGRNAIAKLALPVWKERNGEMIFPSAYSGVKSNESVTVSDLLVCERYPVQDVHSDCAKVPFGNRRVVVVLFNGSKPRLLPDSQARPTFDQKAAALSATLDGLLCVFGSALTCIQANQDATTREVARLRAVAEQSSAQSAWWSKELLKFQQTGPEIVFPLPSDETDQVNLASFARHELEQFVTFVETEGPNVKGVKPQSSGRAATGQLHLNSKPENAEIFLNGELIGGCPATITLAAGKHVLQFKLAGYKDKSTEIQVLPDSESTLFVPLERQ